MSNTLFVIDGDMLKVVYGNRLKCIPFGEMLESHNASFLNKLASTSRILCVDKAVVLSPDDLEAYVNALYKRAPTQVARQMPVVDQSMPDDARPVRASRSEDPVQHSSQPMPNENRSNAKPTWLVSLAKATIIVDDVTDGVIQRGGVSRDKNLVLEPGKPVNLSRLDSQQISDSYTINQCLSNGTFKLIDKARAMAMLREHEERSQDAIIANDFGVRTMDEPIGRTAKSMLTMRDDDVESSFEVSLSSKADDEDMDMSSLIRSLK